MAAIIQETHFIICNAGAEAVSCRFKTVNTCVNEGAEPAPSSQAAATDQADPAAKVGT
jgi:hypothetical protein